MARIGSGVWVNSWTSTAVSIRGRTIVRPYKMLCQGRLLSTICGKSGDKILWPKVPVTEADFNLQGRVDNYREQMFSLLVSLDTTEQDQHVPSKRDKMDVTGQIIYEP